MLEAAKLSPIKNIAVKNKNAASKVMSADKEREPKLEVSNLDTTPTKSQSRIEEDYDNVA